MDDRRNQPNSGRTRRPVTGGNLGDGRTAAATFERPEIPGAGFTRDEFPVAASADPARCGAPPETSPPPWRTALARRAERRVSAGRRTFAGRRKRAGRHHSGPEGHDDDSDV